MKKKAMTEYTRAQVRKVDVACAGRIFNENGGVLVWEMMLRIRRETHTHLAEARHQPKAAGLQSCDGPA